MDGRGRKAEAAPERQVKMTERKLEAGEGVDVATATTGAVMVV